MRRFPTAARWAAPALPISSRRGRTFMVRPIAVAAVAIAAAIATPAFSHHSFAMFDQDRTMVLRGSVKELGWNNPHVWLRVIVQDEATGKELQYGVELGSVAGSGSDGWKPDTVRRGDPITVSIHPL